MINLVLFLESAFMISLLTSNNILMNDCKKNKKGLSTLIYVNFVGAALFLGFIVLVLGKVLSSGSVTFYQNYNVAGFSNNTTNKKLGPSASSYAMFTFTRVAAMFSVVLMILNGIDELTCKDKGWEWLQTINWIFVCVYGIFFVYSTYKLIQGMNTK